MPEDTYGSGGGAQGGVSNLAGDQGGAPVGVAPENSTSGALNPFAGQSGAGNPNMISSSNFGVGGGDIVLNNAGGKPKKTWIIFAVAVILTLVVGSGLVLWGRGLFREKGDKAGTILSLGELRDAFDTYMNYLLYGEDNSEGNLNDFNIGDTFYIDENWQNLDYLKVLLSKYDYFYDNSSILGEALSDIPMVFSKENIEFLIKYQEDDWLKIEDVYKMYSAEGGEKTKDYIKAYYGEELSPIEEADIERMLARINFLDSTGTFERVGEMDDKFDDLIYNKRFFLKYQAREISRALSATTGEVKNEE